MDTIWVCDNLGSALCFGSCHRLCVTEQDAKKKGGKSMPIIFAVAATPLAHFAEGAILAASVYLVSRGAKSNIQDRKK